MKFKSLLAFSILISQATFAQTLPDEINYPPYESQYRSLNQETNQTQSDLNQAESSLSEARTFISEMTNHISDLENNIRSTESEIARLRNLIPNLESQLSNLKNQESSLLQQIRSKEDQETNLTARYNQESRNLAPLKDVVEKKLLRIRQFESTLADVQRQQRDAEMRLTKAQNDHQQFERHINSERDQQKQFKTELAGIEGQINAAVAQISRLESQLQVNEQQLAQERARLQQAEKQVQEDKNALATLRAQGPTPAQLQEAERKLAASTSLRDRTAQQLASLEAQLNKAKAEIVRIRGALPGLESTLNLENQKLVTLTRRVEEYKAELEQIRTSGGTPEQIKDAERKLIASTSARDKTAIQIKELETQIRTGQADLSRYESQLSGLESQTSSERQKLANAEREVSSDRQALETLRNSGPSAERINEAERKLAASTADRERIANSIQSQENQVRQIKADLASKKAEVDNLRRSQSTIPSRIAQSEVRERDFNTQRLAATQEISRLESEIGIHSRNAQNTVNSIAATRNELRNDEANLQNQVNVVDNLNRQMQTTRSEINSLIADHRRLADNIADLTTEIADSKNAIPRHQAQIKADQQEIAQGKQDISRARTDESSLVQTIARLETALATVTRKRDLARAEMDSRVSLYNEHLNAARQLGRGQIQPASGLGEKEGLKIARTLSKFHGEGVGKELGIGEAKYWGTVRGELAGYDQGYALGLQSVEDISHGQAEGRKRGKVDAELTAQTKFRPQYFEDALLLEFQKPLEAGEFMPKMMKRFAYAMEQEASSFNAISPLTADEIKKSDDLKTPLDASVISFKKDVAVINEKAVSLEKPSVVYQAPATVPFGEVNCSTVYKSVAIYKQACEDSYKESFRTSFTTTARSIFDVNYTNLFKEQFSLTNVNTREEQFPTEFAAASLVSEAHGLKLGKADIYQEKFKLAYKQTYDLELPIAKDIAKSDAEKDLVQLLKTKALLTLGKNSFEAIDFRGGEEVSLKAQVKNISQVALSGPVLLKIVEVKNIEFSSKEIALTAAQARNFTNFEALKGKINPAAKTGDKIIVKATVTLPGDLYHPQRQETFEISQVLSANPTHDLKLSYLEFPDSGNVFRRNLHSLKATLVPTAENIPTGYLVKLTPVGENAAFIVLDQKHFETGALSQNVGKELNFTYTFPKTANGKKITLELTVTYAGKIIKKQTIIVTPG